MTIGNHSVLARDDGQARSSADLAAHLRAGATAAQMAEHVVSLWQAIDAALQPIIGKGGVGALHRRSLHLSALGAAVADAGPEARPDDAIDFHTLHRALVQRGAAAAAADGIATLQTFRTLLDALIGPALNDRLLAPAWVSLNLDSAAPEPPP